MPKAPQMVDTNEFALRLSRNVYSLRIARKVVTCALENWDLAHLTDTAAIVVNELASNACEHAAGDQYEVHVTAEEDGVLLEVWDESDELPPEVVELPPADATSGRGLFTIRALSIKTGVEPVPAALGGGKTVWALLPYAEEVAA